MKIRGTLLAIVTLTIILICSLPFGAPAIAGAKPEFEFYGFIKGDIVYDFKRMEPAYASVMRPSQILIRDENTPYYDDGEIIFSMKPTRLGVNFTIPTSKHTMEGKFEIDFYGVGTSASQQLPRLRQAYVSYGSFLAGQAWSLFNDADVWPITMDFWGPSGILASRRPQLRWTPVNCGRNTFAVALEQPGAGLDSGKGPQYDPELDVRPRSVLPDLTAHYKISGEGGHVQVAGIVRSLGFEGSTTLPGDTDETDVVDSVTGWGGYLTGYWKTTDRGGLAAAFTYGEGISNYGNDGGVDVGPDDDLHAVALPYLTWHLSYDAFWSERWSTSLGASQVIQDNSGGQLGDAFHTGTYTFINLVYYPEARLSYGLEFLWGELKTKDGSNNDDFRLDFAVKYAF